jgi:hypothetical protein
LELEAQAATEANERAAAADKAAKEKFAEQMEMERLKFLRRQLEASERATTVTMEILSKPVPRDTRPDHASRLLAVAYHIGGGALGLQATLAGNGFPAGSAPVNIVVALTYDERSRRVDDIKKQFLETHDHTQKERLLCEINERTAEWDRRNGVNGGE